MKTSAKTNLTRLALITISSLFSTAIIGPASAAPSEKTAGVGLISGGALIIPGAQASLPFVGAFQIGWGIGCVLFDPPDTVNAGVPVNLSDFLVYQLRSVGSIYPATPAPLISAIDTYADILDEYVANSRARKVALDRYSGALLIGNPIFAADRLSEANLFLQNALARAKKGVTELPNLFNAFDQYEPGSLDYSVTKSDVLNVRNEIAQGMFPSSEQFAFDDWEISNDEKQLLIAKVGSVPDTIYDEIFNKLDPINGNNTTARYAIAEGTQLCADCQEVPGPLPILGLSAFFSYSRKLRRRCKQLSAAALTE
jgi:hypothetical protein